MNLTTLTLAMLKKKLAGARMALRVHANGKPENFARSAGYVKGLEAEMQRRDTQEKAVK